jgi:hypothetical protein
MPRKTLKIATTGVLLACILAIQALRLPTPIAGVMVNAVLIYAVLLMNPAHAATLATLSPLGAFVTSTLPAPLYPLVPVIIGGNLIYVFLYGATQKKSLLHRTLAPALFKGIFMGAIGFWLVQYLGIAHKVKWLLIPVLGLQSLTAALGTLVAERAWQQSAPPQKC